MKPYALFILLPVTTTLCSGQAAGNCLSDTLPEVTVTPGHRDIRLRPGGVTMHIDPLSPNGNGSLLDALNSIPGITVGHDGEIRLNGIRDAVIIMDGKPVRMSGPQLADMLKSTPAASAARISTSSTPSTRYAASGTGGIIEIIMRRATIPGYSLNGGGTYARGHDGNGTLYSSGSINAGKSSIFVNIGGNRRDETLDVETCCDYSGSDMRYQLWSRRRVVRGLAGRMAADWTPKPATTISFTSRCNTGHRNEFSDMSTIIHSLGIDGLQQSYNTDRWTEMTGELNVTQVFSKAFRLWGSADIIHHTLARSQNGITLQGTSFTTGSRSCTDIGTAEWTLSFTPAGSVKAESGIRYSHTSMHNDAAADRAAFSHHEWTWGAFVEVQWRYRKISLTAGMRGEQTSMRSVRATHIFPMIAASVSLNDDFAFSGSAGRRIRRPNLHDLDPDVQIFDDYTVQRGNPDLKPAVSTLAEWSMVWRDMMRCTIFITHTDDAIIKSYKDAGGRHVVVQPANLTDAIMTGIRTGIYGWQPVRGIDITLTASLMYSRYRWKENTLAGYTPMADMRMTWHAGNEWSGEIHAGCTGQMPYGQATLDSHTSLDLAIKKTVLNGRITFTLFGRDIVGNTRRHTILRISDHTASISENTYGKCAGISVAFRFKKGNATKENKRADRSIESDRVNLQ